MFGNKKYKQAKKKVFENDNKRKQFFAIQNYYKKKNQKGGKNTKN